MKKRLLLSGLVGILTAGWLGAVSVFAATLTIETATDTVAVGGEVVVNLKSEGADTDDPAIKVKYDPAFLTLTGCDAEYTDNSGEVFISAANARLTFDGKADGMAKISADGALSADGSSVTAEAQISVGTGAAVTQAGSDASQLKSLEISPGTLKPAFSSAVTAYTIDVTDDTELVNVTCSLVDPSAKVTSASGFKNLKKGTNQASITVQGADGSKTTYNIAINRGAATAAPATESTTDAGSAEASDTGVDASSEGSADVATSIGAGDGAGGFNIGAAEGNAVSEGTGSGETTAPNPDGTITVGGDSIYSTFLVQPAFTAEVPAGFVKENYVYKGNNVESAYFAAGGIRLLYLTAGDGNNAAFRIYYIDTDTFYDFYPIAGKNGTFIIPVRFEAQEKIPYNYTGTYLPLDTTVIPAYIYTELTGRTVIGGEGEQSDSEIEKALEENKDPVDVDSLEEDPEFYLIYAMNSNGSEGFYLYDIVEDTFQRYVERDTSSDLDQSYFKYKKVAHTRFAVMCVLGVLLLVAVFVIINLILKNRELKEDLSSGNGGFGGSDRPKKKASKKPAEREERRADRRTERRKAEEDTDDVDVTDMEDDDLSEHRRVKRSERYGSLASAAQDLEDDLNFDIDLDDDDDDMTIAPSRSSFTQTGSIGQGTGSIARPAGVGTGTGPMRSTGSGTGPMSRPGGTTGPVRGVGAGTGQISRPAGSSTGSVSGVGAGTGQISRPVGTAGTGSSGRMTRTSTGTMGPINRPAGNGTGPISRPGGIRRTGGVTGATGQMTTSSRPPVTTHTGSIYHTNTNIILPETGDDEIKIARPATSTQSAEKGISRQIRPGGAPVSDALDVYDLSEDTTSKVSVSGMKKTGATGPIREAQQIKEQARKTRTVRSNSKRDAAFQMINLARESDDLFDDDFEFDFLNPGEDET